MSNLSRPYTTALRAALLAAFAVSLWPLHAARAEVADDERAQLERQLEETRAEIRRLSQRLGELSVELTDKPLRRIIRQRAFHADRAMIGATIQSNSGERGVIVVAVTPEGPAAKAGLKAGDVIVGIDDVSLATDDGSAAQKLTRALAAVDVGAVVRIDFERDGRPLSETLTTAQMSGEHEKFAFAFGDHEFDVDIDFDGADGPATLQGKAPFEFLFHSGPWSDMEVVALTPALGDYFGVAKGLLVVRAPRDSDLALIDGDVIAKVNGQPVTAPRELLHALVERRAGESVNFDIVRQRQAMTVSARVPEDQAASSHRFKFGGPQIFIQRSEKESAE